MDAGVIVVQPLGDSLPQLVGERLREGIPEAFGLSVRVAEPLPPPERAWNSSRGQYLGRRLLRFLSKLERPDALRLVGIVDADAYARGLNFCFGQARLNGREAFVALSRLRPAYYGQPPDPHRFAERALREVVHELGHTFGLAHCSNDCVMRFANSLYEVDVRAATFCDVCRAMLDETLGRPG